MLKSNELIVLGRRKTLVEFALSELLVYCSQVAVFFLVATFVSGFLRDEKQLLGYINSKISSDPSFELVVTVVALISVFGFLVVFAKPLSKGHSQFIQQVADEVLNDFPKLIYALGSTISGIAFAAGIFIASHPSTQAPRPAWWVSMALLIGFGFFSAGLVVNYGLKYKTHIVGT